MAVLMLWNVAVPARAFAASLCTDASAEPDQAPNAAATAITAASRWMMVRWCVMGLLLAFAFGPVREASGRGPRGASGKLPRLAPRVPYLSGVVAREAKPYRSG